MPLWPTQNASAMNAFYGDPDVNNDLSPDLDWQQKHLTTILPAYPMFYIGKPVKKITVHKLCADSLLKCLTGIGKAFTEEEIRRYRLDEYGGCFNFRAKRGNPESLSIHSWAAAIDISPTINAFKVKAGSVPNMMPAKVVEIFGEEGWVGGQFWKPNADGMHFQAARLG